MKDNSTESHPLTPLPGTQDERDEREIRRQTYQRVLELLNSDQPIPPGQLLAFAAKIGFSSSTGEERPQVRNQNIFAILPGLPRERQEQIIEQFDKELKKARKELDSG